VTRPFSSETTFLVVRLEASDAETSSITRNTTSQRAPNWTEFEEMSAG
jgi:hypothetical protein